MRLTGRQRETGVQPRAAGCTDALPHWVILAVLLSSVVTGGTPFLAVFSEHASSLQDFISGAKQVVLAHCPDKETEGAPPTLNVTCPEGRQRRN